MQAGLLLLLLQFVLPGGAPEEWDHFEKQVRDRTLPAEAARRLFPGIYRALAAFVRNQSFAPRAGWVFPVSGYSVEDAGKGGFRPDIRYGGSSIKGYDFYDGDRHGGHPAYDIFIRDRNQDALDDSTGRPVRVLAPLDVLVTSIHCGWKRDSDIRGGNYVWAWAPQAGLLLYFAHLGGVQVERGTVLRAGECVGTVGRSGRNAAPHRSPTHLHLMVLRVEGSELIPVDFLPLLARPSGASGKPGK